MKINRIFLFVILAVGVLVLLNKYAERIEVARELVETEPPVTVSGYEQKAQDTRELNISRFNTITNAVQEIEPAVEG
jgi:hypothetical protein